MEGKLKFDEFQKKDDKQWEEKLLSDLKGKPIPTVKKGGFILNPFLTKTKDSTIKLNNKKNGAWQMSISFDIKDAQQLNQAILSSLQLGIQHISITWYDELNEAIVFKDVQKDIIDITILKEPKTQIALNLQSDDDYLDAFRRIKKSATDGQKSIDLLASKDFIFNIAFIRATKMFLAQNDLSTSIRVVPEYSQLDEDQDIQCIEKTMIGLASVIGTADLLELAHVDQDTTENDYGRIAQMIHHILREEAHLSQVHDPLAGSYFIEELTDKILQKSKDL